MLHIVALVRTDVSEDRSAFIIRVTRIGELGATLAVTNNCSTLRRLIVTATIVPISQILVTPMMEALGSNETFVLTTATGVTSQNTTVENVGVRSMHGRAGKCV
jgi:hypothetical protein